MVCERVPLVTGIPPIQKINWRKMGAMNEEEDIKWFNLIPGKYVVKVKNKIINVDMSKTKE